MGLETSQTSIEVTAPSTEEAIIIGLTRLGLTREDVNITVLEEASKGFLGLGAHQARVQLTQKTAQAAPAAAVTPTALETPVKDSPQVAPDNTPPAQAMDSPEVAAVEVEPTLDDVNKAVSVPESVTEASVTTPEDKHTKSTSSEDSTSATPDADDKLDRTAIEAAVQEATKHLFPNLDIRITTQWQQEDRPTLWISIQGKEADMLIGPRAQTLNSVQYLFRTLIHHKVDGDYNIVVDAAKYRQRRRNNLKSLAHKKAKQAIDTGRTIRLRPMPAGERRLIHMILRKDDRVETESVGHGNNRAITIIPVKKSR